MGLSLCLFTFMHLVVSLLVLFHSTAAASNKPLICHDHEHTAILQFKESHSRNDSYCSSTSLVALGKTKEGNVDCCSWDGVKCNEETGHVIKLDLSSSCLYGSINSSSSLFHLVHLQWLNLAYNNFDDSEIPSGIMNLSRLSYLNLSSSGFRGQIPLEILELSNLESLDLSQNGLKLGKPSLGNLVEKLINLKNLDLSYVNFATSIPHFFGNMSSLTFLSLPECGLQGTIPSSLGDLTKLVDLDLSSNELWGELPASIGNLTSLKYLDMSWTTLWGELPATIGYLSSLKYLDISNSELYDKLPSSIGNLTSLETLDLSSNKLSGQLPTSIGNLRSLKEMQLSSNALSGELPNSIGNLGSSMKIVLSDNHFLGNLPASIENLTQLSILDLSFNSFSGTIELEKLLHKLINLATLFLSSNSLSLLTNPTVNTTSQKFLHIGLRSCNLTKFPNFLQKQNHLLLLDLSSNKITGPVPGWLNSNLTSLGELNLSHNHLTEFHQQMVVFPWTDLFLLDLSSNELEGRIPVPTIATEILLVSNNRLSGQIPTSMCNLNKLYALDLSNNNLSGVLPPCLGNFSAQLSILKLRSNKFYGSIPQFFMDQLSMIDLNNNLLQGKIPRSFGNCTSLAFLDLGNNQINDTFPSFLENLLELRVLILRSNKFYGAIGEPKTFCWFTKLRIIDLSHNGFTGGLPSKNFKCWIAMKYVDTSQLTYMSGIIPHMDPFFDFTYRAAVYDYSLTVSNKGNMMAYEKIPDILTCIVFSNNRFDGEIPVSIANLEGLKILNLSNNNLQGHIPSRLANLINLESLDLSNNELSGEIPQKLIELTFLSFFDVSHNNLTGLIPQGNQFTTFENSSFDGNSGLCGKPLSKKCENDSKMVENEDKQGSKSPFTVDMIIVLLGYSAGLIVGVTLGLNFSTRMREWTMEKLGRQLKNMTRKKGCRS